MKTTPPSGLAPPHAPPSKLRFANTANSSSFWLLALVTAQAAITYDTQKLSSGLLLFVWGMGAVYYLHLSLQERLELKIALLLDRLEQKGVLSTEERAAIGIVPPKIIEATTMRGVCRALIYVGAAVLLLALLLFFSATCSGTH